MYSKNDINELLAKGHYGNIPCMRYCVRKNTGAEVNRIMVSVSKKFFKRAVKRNLLKRRIRESYRKQKGILPAEGGIDILFMYNTKEILTYNQIYEMVGKVLENAVK